MGMIRLKKSQLRGLIREAVQMRSLREQGNDSVYFDDLTRAQKKATVRSEIGQMEAEKDDGEYAGSLSPIAAEQRIVDRESAHGPEFGYAESYMDRDGLVLVWSPNLPAGGSFEWDEEEQDWEI